MNTMSVHVDGDKVCITAIGEGDCDELVQIVIKNRHDGTLLIEPGDDETVLQVFNKPCYRQVVISTPHDWTRSAQLDEATV